MWRVRLDLTSGMLYATLWVLLLVILRSRKNLGRISSPEVFTVLTQENVKPQNLQFPFLFLSATPAGNRKQPTINTSPASRYRGVKYAYDTRGLS